LEKEKREHRRNIMGEIEDRILKIIFYDKKKGYTIAKYKVYGEQWFMNVLGYHLPSPIGEILKLTGECIGHDKYGLQFHVDHYEVLRPAPWKILVIISSLG